MCHQNILLNFVSHAYFKHILTNICSAKLKEKQLFIAIILESYSEILIIKVLYDKSLDNNCY